MTDPVLAIETTIAADRAHDDKALWITRLPDEELRARARALADEGPRDRPLFGVPVAVKDNIDVAGMPTTAACPAYAYTPTANAPSVQRLIDSGAIIVGKTNLDQFATGLTGVRSPYGIPRNVFSPAHVPGGSSSGSAVAVAAGIVPLALGTDTAGSGRVPAMFNNIVGLKPTVGAVPTRGVVPACRSIDTVSIFGRTVDESLVAMRIISGDDPDDRYARAAPFAHLRRCGLPRMPRLGLPYVDEEMCAKSVVENYYSAASPFSLQPVDLTPFLEIAKLLYAGPWVAERTAGLREIVTNQPEALHPITRIILESGFDRSIVDGFDAFHMLAAVRREARTLFTQIDALLVPTAPFTPTIAETEDDPLGPNSRLGTFTNFVNLCDLAAVAVPSGFGRDGLPCGVTVIGPAWSDGWIAAIADAIHRTAVSTIGATRQGLTQAAQPDDANLDETAIFCIGAHMSGLPLNHSLVSRGGRFVREASTAPLYTLFALGNRPGLVRVGANGASIAGEVWVLPTAAVGAVLAEVAPPLGFGTVTLESGPCLGFLAESAGVVGAPDITALGGWRAFLAR
jgi:allophanate hydrolase